MAGGSIDRSSRRWRTLLELARLLLGTRWQETRADARAPEGVTLLFPMNELFEHYIAVQLRHALADTELDVVAQGGFAYCLGPWRDGTTVVADSHPTRPDILVKRGNRVVAVLDTKWKHPEKGISHADIYQMMAYARLYDCQRLTLLYPALPGKRLCAPTLAASRGVRSASTLQQFHLNNCLLMYEPRFVIWWRTHLPEFPKFSARAIDHS